MTDKILDKIAEQDHLKAINDEDRYIKLHDIELYFLYEMSKLHITKHK